MISLCTLLDETYLNNFTLEEERQQPNTASAADDRESKQTDGVREKESEHIEQVNSKKKKKKEHAEFQ